MTTPTCPNCHGTGHRYDGWSTTASTGYVPCTCLRQSAGRQACLPTPQPRPDWVVPLGIDERGDCRMLERLAQAGLKGQR